MNQHEKPSQAIKAAFSEWALAKRGSENPQRQTNPVWAWLAETRLWPHKSHELAGAGSKQEPGWCFCRYGQSETLLEDGRTVFIGGEHEDFYDPDFYIYNDVTVFEDGRVSEVFGYPTTVFPPTDFHSATLLNGRIIIVGRLGYPEDRSEDTTPAFVLRLDDFTIRELKTSGDQPAWMHEHSAKLDETGEAIICEGGVVTLYETGRTIENIASWRLCLVTGAWSKVGEKPWSRWLLMRNDESPNELWELSQLSWAHKTKREDQFSREIRQKLAARGHEVNAELYEARYSPTVEVFEITEDSDDFRRHTVSYGRQKLRFDEQYDAILLTAECALAVEEEKALLEHYIAVFSELEGVPYKTVKI
ncbi:MAG: hypothetical protein AAF668_16510 [Pseudomonadota bacterium]